MKRRIAMMCASLLLGSCVMPQSRDAVMEPVSEAAWSEVQSTQIKRLERLATVSTSGQFTLRWSEEGSRRWEQVDLRLWWELPNAMALRLSRVGRRLAVAGWNDGQWWVFDQTGDETALAIFDTASDGAGDDLLLSPPLLLAAAGLGSYPIEKPADAVESADGKMTFSMRVASLDPSWRAHITLTHNKPTAVLLRADDGTLIARSLLTDHRPVETAGIAQGAWPMLPFRIRVFQPSADGSEGEVSISLDQPTAGVRVPKTMFDLEVLREKLEPSIVDDQRVKQ